MTKVWRTFFFQKNQKCIYECDHGLPVDESTHCPLQGGLSCGRLAERTLLTGCELKSLIEVSSEHTPIILLSRRGSLDRKVDDLATTLDASQVCETTDVRRLSSPLFSGARSKCYPIRCFLFSDTFKHGEIQARC